MRQQFLAIQIQWLITFLLIPLSFNLSSKLPIKVRVDNLQKKIPEIFISGSYWNSQPIDFFRFFKKLSKDSSLSLSLRQSSMYPRYRHSLLLSGISEERIVTVLIFPASDWSHRDTEWRSNQNLDGRNAFQWMRHLQMIILKSVLQQTPANFPALSLRGSRPSLCRKAIAALTGGNGGDDS